MPSRPDENTAPSRLGFDAVILLSQDLLEQHGLDGRGESAAAAAKLGVERLPGAAMVRVQWRGPQPGAAAAGLVTVYPIGSATAATGRPWQGLQDFAGALVRDALDALAKRG